MPETDRVSRVYSVASVLCLQFVLCVLLFRLRTLLYFTLALLLLLLLSSSSSSSPFMQGIYTYIPETNCVPTEYSVVAILLLLFMVLISLVAVLNLLYFYISTLLLLLFTAIEFSLGGSSPYTSNK